MVSKAIGAIVINKVVGIHEGVDRVKGVSGVFNLYFADAILSHDSATDVLGVKRVTISERVLTWESTPFSSLLETTRKRCFRRERCRTMKADVNLFLVEVPDAL